MKELRNTLLFFMGVAFVFLVFHWMRPKAADMPLQRPMDVAELPGGKIVVTDGGGFFWNDSGSKVLVIDRNKKLVWSYRGNLRFAHGTAVLKNGNFLFVDSGNDRLLETDRNKNHVWTSERWGGGWGWGKLSDGSSLNFPFSVCELHGGKLLISDSGNGRIIETDRSGKVYRRYSGFRNPGAASVDSAGNVLVADAFNNKIAVMDRDGKTLRRVSAGLQGPQSAEDISGGRLLITDTLNDRVIVTDSTGKIQREIKGMLNRPSKAVSLKSGNILVCDTGHARLLEFDASNRVVWEFRNINSVFVRDSLTNGGAEERNGKKTVGWTVCDLYAHNDGVWSVDEKTFKEGSNSLSVQAKEMPAGKMFWGQPVKAVSGSEAEFFAFVKTELTAGVSGIGLVFLDSLNGNIGETNMAVKGLTNGWSPAVLKVRIPGNAAVVFAILYMEGTGRTWFDDVRLSMKPDR